MAKKRCGKYTDFLHSCPGVEGGQLGRAVVRGGAGEDAGGKGEPQAGEEDQGAADAVGGRAQARRPIQGAEREGESD